MLFLLYTSLNQEGLANPVKLLQPLLGVETPRMGTSGLTYCLVNRSIKQEQRSDETLPLQTTLYLNLWSGLTTLLHWKIILR